MIFIIGIIRSGIYLQGLNPNQMLHYFRKIRRDLITNSQSIKYLKYAIGEVILVVLGILIALQINNWKEKRNNDYKKEVHIQRLSNDLGLDTMNLGYYVDACEREISHWRNIEKQIRKPNATLDSIIKIFTNNPLGIPQLRYQNKATLIPCCRLGILNCFKKINWRCYWIIMLEWKVLTLDFYLIKMLLRQIYKKQERNLGFYIWKKRQV